MAIMNRDGLLALYEYNADANCLVLDGLAQLSEDEFTHASSPSHGSIRSLLLHTFEAETWFLVLGQGREFQELNLQTLDDFRRYQSELEQGQQAFIATLSESDLAREVTFQIRDHPYHLPVWQLLVQAFEHSTHHRAELGLLLGQMGHSLPTLDIIIHFMRASGQPWPPR
jgi:uncharacterized damage-inducible protein DinB